MLRGTPPPTALLSALGLVSIVTGGSASSSFAGEPPGRGLAAPGSALIKGRVVVKSETLFGASTGASSPPVVFVKEIPGFKAKPGRPGAMAQKDKAFKPSLLLIPAGSTVKFPNEDLFFHNVFSLSAGNDFDLGMYSQGDAKSVRFTQPGVVEVFCNIHPEMVGTIIVLQNPYVAQATPDGAYELSVPPGNHTLVAWSPDAPPAAKTIRAEAGRTLALDFEVTEKVSKERHLNKYGQPYGRYK